MLALGCSQAPAPRQPVSIAILPVQAGTSAAPIDWLCRGLTADLIDAAGAIPGLQVAGPVSTMVAGGQKDAAAALAVESVLRTEIDEKGALFTIRLQLVRASDGETIGRQVLSRGPEEMIRVHHEVAKLLAGWLRKEAPDLPVKSLTADLDAHYLYWRGLNERYRAGGKLETEIEYYDKALQRDGYFAAAYTRSAEARVALLRAGRGTVADVEKARTIARRAVELGEDSAGAHAALGGFLFWIDWKWAEASMLLREAMEWQPSHAAANGDYAALLTASRRFGDALPQLDAATRIEPLDMAARQSSQWLRIYARAWSPEQARSVPRAPLALLAALSESFAGNHAKATELAAAAQQDGLATPVEVLHAAHVWRSAGRQDKAAQLLETFREGGPLFLAAAAALRMSDREEVIRMVRTAVEQRDPNIVWIHLLPMFDSLRNDQRFAAIASQVGMTADEKPAAE
ncbi:MAG: hypothetical protein JNK48_02170 [Bryobacterales bacterium]|nr:hypothetical protein [Bryobacterales bacterium]